MCVCVTDTLAVLCLLCGIFFFFFFSQNLLPYTAEISKKLKPCRHSLHEMGHGEPDLRFVQQQQKNTSDPFQCISEHES